MLLWRVIKDDTWIKSWGHLDTNFKRLRRKRRRPGRRRRMICSTGLVLADSEKAEAEAEAESGIEESTWAAATRSKSKVSLPQIKPLKAPS